MYMGFCTTPIAANTDDGGWQGLPAISAARRRRRASSARFVVALPERRAQRPAEPHLPDARAPDRSAGHTDEATYLLAAPGVRSTTRGARPARSTSSCSSGTSVNREDIDIVERVQRGLANTAYTGGRMCYRFEESVHRFQNMVVDRMLGVRRVPEGDAESSGPDVRARSGVAASFLGVVARDRRLEPALVYQLVAVPRAELGREVKRSSIGTHRGAYVDAGAPVAAPDRDPPLATLPRSTADRARAPRSGRCRAPVLEAVRQAEAAEVAHVDGALEPARAGLPARAPAYLDRSELLDRRAAARPPGAGIGASASSSGRRRAHRQRERRACIAAHAELEAAGRRPDPGPVAGGQTRAGCGGPPGTRGRSRQRDAHARPARRARARGARRGRRGGSG